MLRVWVVVYVANLLGGGIFAFILIYLITSMDLMNVSDVEGIIEPLLKPSHTHILVSAIIAGWLMGLLSWLITTAKETISRILIVFLIGIEHLHHCIVGSIEILTGVLVSDQVSLMDYVRIQGLATFGNAFGGVVFVAVLKYAHINPKEAEKDIIDERF